MNEICVLNAIPETRNWVLAKQKGGDLVGFVPTMGALHEGHLSLIRRAKAECGAVIISIFVNPLQFGPAEDYSRYPRTFQDDCRLAEEAGAEAIFAPSETVMYPSGALTTVTVRKLGDHLCGPHRPGHFDGVCTVVAKLFSIVPAQRAYFGEKDFQQLRIIQRMASDLDFPVEIVACPTVREADGLAMSSRNRYLSPTEREMASALPAALADSVGRFRSGVVAPEKLLAPARTKLEGAGLHVQYLEIVDQETLQPVPQVSEGCRIAAAVFAGSTRLIDNMPFEL